MMNEDQSLVLLNETELLQMARRQGLGVLRRGIPRNELLSIITGYYQVRPEHLAGTAYTRKKLQENIAINIERVRSQLPGCDGRCTTYPCSEGRHALCFMPNEALVR